MIEELSDPSKRYVGLKQVVRAIEAGRAGKVFLASDADDYIKNRILSLCAHHGVGVERAGDMAELGKLCAIEVRAAVAALIKQA